MEVMELLLDSTLSSLSSGFSTASLLDILASYFTPDASLSVPPLSPQQFYLTSDRAALGGSK